VNQLVPITSPALPVLIAAAGERAGMRFLEFFAANIRDPHTRRAYARRAGLEVIRDYCDVAMSGRRQGRPRLNALMAAARNHEIDWG
jgi:hypothetical protein